MKTRIEHDLLGEKEVPADAMVYKLFGESRISRISVGSLSETIRIM